MVTTIPISVVIVVYGDIKGNIVQWLASFFWTGDVKVTLSLLSEVLPPTGKAIDLWRADPMLRLVTGHLMQVGWGERFSFTGQVGKPF